MSKEKPLLFQITRIDEPITVSTYGGPFPEYRDENFHYEFICPDCRKEYLCWSVDEFQDWWNFTCNECGTDLDLVGVEP